MKHRIEIGEAKKRRRRAIPSSINELLARDDVNGIMQDLDNARPSIDDLIVIYTDRDTGQWVYSCNSELLSSKAVWLLESVKYDMIAEDSEDE